MPRKSAEATDTELALLNLLWDRGACEVRDLVQRMYKQHTPALHATVKSLLERLAEKGLVECDRSRFAHTFSATLDRETYVGRQLQKLADSHFAGSLAPMLLQLVERVQLKPSEHQAIRQIVERLD